MKQPPTDSECRQLASDLIDQVNIKAADAEMVVAVKAWLARVGIEGLQQLRQVEVQPDAETDTHA